MQPFFAYMLRCGDGSYYVGHTDELEKRIAEHQAGASPGYTCARRPVELVWSEEFSTREEALETELKLKGWSRAKKEALIRGDWSSLKALARGPDRSERRRRAEQGSPFDSGPASGGPYAQGERRNAPPSSEPESSVRPERSGRAAADPESSVRPERSGRAAADPESSVRPERSGRAAAAESKDERCVLEPPHA